MKQLLSILKSRRLWGLAGTASVLYLLVFVVFGKLDMSWIMPDTNEIARTFTAAWPQMPFFDVQKDAPEDTSKAHYIYYTVPTRQFTPAQLLQMGVTNAVPHPAAPKH